MNNEFVNEAGKIVNEQLMKESNKEIAKLSMSIYKAYKEEGFNDKQAFEFMKDYVIAALTRNSK